MVAASLSFQMKDDSAKPREELNVVDTMARLPEKVEPLKFENWIYTKNSKSWLVI
jgi:N12 class adenine-specific DNA methylase